MLITAIAQNLSHGGFRLSGADQVVDDRWEDLRARILSAGRPDIVVLNFTDRAKA